MYKCDKCGKELKNLMALSGHQAQCGKEKLSCPICQRKVSSFCLSVHVKAHDRDVPCLSCGKITGGGNKFCSKSCSATFNNKGVRRHGNPPGNCLGCGAKLSLFSRKYCSNACQRTLDRKLFADAVKRLGGFPAGSGVKRIKNYLKDKFGNKCSVCLGTDWMGKQIPLELDHIDGNFENNTLSNLRLVCGNCGMQLPTYKARNWGNGRYSRRKRYQEGKSY